MQISEVKDNLRGLFHGGNIDTVTNINSLFERCANTMQSKIDVLETIRTAALSSTIHDDIYNYSLPSDYKKLIDLLPQDNRESIDTAGRRNAEYFDLNKAITEKNVSVEGSEGSKMIRINWRSRQGTTLHSMNSVTDNGTWTAVGTATGISANTIFKTTGSASIEFNIVTTGDGIQNTTMDAVDLTDEDEVGDFFTYMYFGTVPTSVTAYWGNDLTTNYWTSVAQTTQADGTAFKVGWNLLKFPWSTATESGTVAPATIDSFKITIASSAQNNVRIDNIICSIGRNFDLKYYSKYLFKNSAGTWISKPTSDNDTLVLDNDAMQIFLMECLIALSQQSSNPSMKSDFDFARLQLNGDGGSPNKSKSLQTGLYSKYRKEFPSMAKKIISFYGGLPARNRW